MKIDRRPWLARAHEYPAILWALATTYAVALSILSIARHYGFYSLEDVGAFSQMLWSTLHGKLFYTDLPGLGRFAFTPHNYLGDHFSPLLFLLIPLYAVWSGPEPLLILQSVALGVAALPLYLIVQERFRDRRLSLSFALAWLISPYVWQSNIADFHLDTLEPLFIFWAFFYLFKKRLPHYLTFIILSLLCKEDSFVYVIAIGIFALLSLRDMKFGLCTIAMGSLWALATFKLFMPLFGGGMAYVDHYSQFGSSVPAIARTLLLEPHRVIVHLSQSPISQAVFRIFLAVGLLPLLSPAGLILLTPPTLERLLTNRPEIHSLSWYYSMAALPLFFIACVTATSNILRLASSEDERRRYRTAVAGLLIIAGLISASYLGFGILGDFSVRMPAPTISTDGWIWVSRRDREIRTVLSEIPQSASVSTSPYIASHVPNRFNIRVFPYRPLDRDVILLDLYGQKYPADLAAYKCALAAILSGAEYGVVEYLDGFVYLRRGQATSRNASVARNVASILEAEDLFAHGAERVFDLGAGNKFAMRFPAKRRPGGILFGPYVSLPPGAHEVTFRMKVRDRTSEDIARLDVTADHGSRILTQRTVRGSDFHEAGRYQEFRLDIHSREAIENVEFRVHRYGGSEFRIDRMNVYPPEDLALKVMRDSCPR